MDPISGKIVAIQAWMGEFVEIHIHLLVSVVVPADMEILLAHDTHSLFITVFNSFDETGLSNLLAHKMSVTVNSNVMRMNLVDEDMTKSNLWAMLVGLQHGGKTDIPFPHFLRCGSETPQSNQLL